MSIGHSLAEIMRYMTPHTTDHGHDQYITALFFHCRGGKKYKKVKPYVNLAIRLWFNRIYGYYIRCLNLSEKSFLYLNNKNSIKTSNIKLCNSSWIPF
jgi:hypothetical protein